MRDVSGDGCVRVHVRSVALGAVVALGLIILPGMQQLVPTGSSYQPGGAPGVAFGPAPEDIVNIDSGNFEGQSSRINLEMGEMVPIYTVPDDRWLVVTQWEANVSQWSSNLVSLVEDHYGEITVKRNHRFLSVTRESQEQGAIDVATGEKSYGRVGLVFRPGSNVSLVNLTLTASYDADVAFHMTGYLHE